MKNKLICTLLITSSVVASTIMPEMRRNKKETTDSVLGMAWSKRNALGIMLAKSSSEVEVLSEKTSDVDVMGIAPYVFFYNNNFSTEIAFAKAEVETKPVNDDLSKADADLIDAKFALRTSEELALVASLSSISASSDEDTDDTKKRELAFGISSNLGNGFIIGANYSLNNYEVGLADVGYSSFKIGTGHQEWNGVNGHSVELYYSKQNAESETTNTLLTSSTVSVGDISTIGLSGLYAIDSIELFAAFELINAESYDKTVKVDSSEFNLALEYLATENFYVTPKFTMAKSESTDSSGSSNDVTNIDGITYELALGYRTSDMDLSFSFGKVTAEETETDEDKEEASGTNLEANLAYFF